MYEMKKSRADFVVASVAEYMTTVLQHTSISFYEPQSASAPACSSVHSKAGAQCSSVAPEESLGSIVIEGFVSKNVTLCHKRKSVQA